MSRRELECSMVPYPFHFYITIQILELQVWTIIFWLAIFLLFLTGLRVSIVC